MKDWLRSRSYLFGMLPSVVVSVVSLALGNWSYALVNAMLVVAIFCVTEVIFQKRHGSTYKKMQEHPADVPIIAYKVAMLWANLNGPQLQSRFGHFPYDGSDWARCHNTSSHDAPKLDCTCGFYAMRSKDQLQRRYGYPSGPLVLLEVELFGRVIVCADGYRAQRQRILQVDIGSCSCADCDRPVEIVLTDASQLTGGSPCICLCGDHSTVFHSNRTVRTWTLKEVADSLGAPVKWVKQ